MTGLPQLESCSIRHVDAGEIVMEADSYNNQVFVLLLGTVSVFLLEDGSDPVTVHLYPGESIGEFSVISGQPIYTYEDEMIQNLFEKIE